MKKKIKKWDEINGVAEVDEPVESIDATADAGAGPSISRNYMRGIEDMVEQNDNNFDGVINNVKTDIPTGIADAKDKEKESVLKSLKEDKRDEPFWMRTDFKKEKEKEASLCPYLER